MKRAKIDEDHFFSWIDQMLSVAHIKRVVGYASRGLGVMMLGSSMSFASLVINPVSLDLSNKQATQEIVMENQTDEVKAFNVKIQQWRQEKGNDIYTETKDVIVIPLVAKIPPKSKQKFRVILKNTPQGKEQVPYRLFFNEIPHQSTSKIDGSAITFLLNMTVPVFATGTNYKALEKATWSAEYIKKDQSLILSLANAGSKFMKIRNIAAKEIPSFMSGDWQYVLPSTVRSWTIPFGKKSDPASLALTYMEVDSFDEVKRTTTVPVSLIMANKSGVQKMADSKAGKKQ